MHENNCSEGHTKYKARLSHNALLLSLHINLAHYHIEGIPYPLKVKQGTFKLP